MSSVTITLIVFGCVFGAAVLGIVLRHLLPEHHFSADTKDTVKLAMGFVGTMSALILGLLVASAKDSYDKQSSGVTQMAAKVIYLDRMLANFGPETTEVRTIYRKAVEHVTEQMWHDGGSTQAQLDPGASRSEELLAKIEALNATSDLQKTLKAQAVSTTMELGQLRWLEYEQAGAAASKPMLTVLVFWIAILFGSFGMFAPKNGTAMVALLLAAISVAGAIFLILELRSPFSGPLQIPKAPFLDAIAHLGK